MSKGNEQANFAINLGGDAAKVAKSTADELSKLRAKMQGGTDSMRTMNAALRNLKGGGAEAVAMAKDLKASIAAKKQALAQATVEALKLEKANGILGISDKKLTEAKDRLKARVESLKSAVAGAAVAVVALTAAVAASLVSLGRFALTGADAARSADLLREAAMGGNGQWGKQYGEQVDALSKLVPTAREEIDKLGRSFASQNIGGQLLVDSMNAVAQASAALGDAAGAKVKSFIERAMLLGQPGLFRISPQELIGTGVTFQQVAEQLATSMHVGVDKAKAALFDGRVKLADGARAMRAAIEKNLADINLRQMLSLPVLARKFEETLQDLTRGVKLEPLLKGLKDIASVFDLSTTSGQALKQLVTVFGSDLVGAFASSTPLAKKFLYGLILGAQELTMSYLRVRNSLREAFSGTGLDNVVLMSAAFDAGKLALKVFAAGIATTAIGIGAIAAAGGAAVAAVYGLVEAVKAGWKSFTTVDWGDAIIDGLVSGITGGWDRLRSAVGGLAEKVKLTFKDALGIHSPSRVFAEYGENTTEGYSAGVERGAGGAQGAVDAMVKVPASSGRGATAGAPIHVEVHINASGSNAKEVAAQIASDSTIEKLTKALIDALHGAGIPVPG